MNDIDRTVRAILYMYFIRVFFVKTPSFKAFFGSRTTSLKMSYSLFKGANYPLVVRNILTYLWMHGTREMTVQCTYRKRVVFW